MALGGDGPDELFAGYELFPGFRAAELYRALPEVVRTRLVEPLCRLLPQSSGYVNPRFVAEQFIGGAMGPRWLRSQRWLAAFTAEAQQGLWTDRLPAEALELDRLYASTREAWESFPAEPPVARLFYVLARQFMLDYILVKVDRCSMMHSLEARAPFLDRDFAEFVCRLPIDMKMRWPDKRKYLLKKVAAPLLPRRILSRPKRGFLIPSSQWLRESLRPVLEDLCSERRLREQGLFRPERVRAMMDAHFSGQQDLRKPLWTMLVLQLWLQAHKPRIA